MAVLFAVLLAFGLAACDHSTVYYHYEHTSVAGWERNDTLVFDTPAFPAAARYAAVVGLRTSDDFPFMGLNLIVEQTSSLRGILRSDTLNCRLVDDHGRTTGQGMNQYQYLFPLPDMLVQPDERLHITIRHNMRRELLPGISDVGLRIYQK